MSTPVSSPRPKVILLDVYETLLDMSDVERRLNALFDSKRGYLVWFELFMQYCFVDNCTVQFNEFSAIAKATMQMTARIFNRHIPDSKFEHVIEGLTQLPLKENVQLGLSGLYEQGFRIAALTNSSAKIVKDRMNRTGLISYFEMVMSAEEIKKYKPCTEVYVWAAKQLKEEPSNILMVTAHGWDIGGAAHAGMQTAYIDQSKQMLYPLAPAPDYTANHMADLCSQLHAVYA